MSAEAPRDRKMEIFDICAVNLIPCDNSSKIASTVGKLLHKSPSSDPYVIFAIGGERVQTKEIKNTLNPKWEEHLTLKVPHNAKDMIVSVFDRDRFTSDDQMGVYQFKIPQVNRDACRMDACLWGSAFN